MSAPARKPLTSPEPTPGVSPQTPQRRPRRLRQAEPADAAGAPGAPPTAAAGPGEVRRLQDRIARAFSPRSTALETLLMRLIILAVTCLFLRTALIGGGLVAGLPH